MDIKLTVVSPGSQECWGATLFTFYTKLCIVDDYFLMPKLLQPPLKFTKTYKNNMRKHKKLLNYS